MSGPNNVIVGHALYVAMDRRQAELALAVADRFQARGLGTMLLEQLARADVLRESGFQPSHAANRVRST